MTIVPKYVNITQFCEYMGISQTFLRQHYLYRTKPYPFPAYQPGRTWLIEIKKAEEYILKNPVRRMAKC